MREKGEGSGGEGGVKWGKGGRELGMGYPLSAPSSMHVTVYNVVFCDCLECFMVSTKAVHQRK